MVRGTLNDFVPEEGLDNLDFSNPVLPCKKSLLIRSNKKNIRVSNFDSGIFSQLSPSGVLDPQAAIELAEEKGSFNIRDSFAVPGIALMPPPKSSTAVVASSILAANSVVDMCDEFFTPRKVSGGRFINGKVSRPILVIPHKLKLV